jgi:hypothetical protein
MQQANEWATAPEDSNYSNAAATAKCCLIIYLETTMEGTLPCGSRLHAVDPLKDAPAILAIAAQCLNGAYQNKQTHRRTVK